MINHFVMRQKRTKSTTIQRRVNRRHEEEEKENKLYVGKENYSEDNENYEKFHD